MIVVKINETFFFARFDENKVIDLIARDLVLETNSGREIKTSLERQDAIQGAVEIAAYVLITKDKHFSRNEK